MTSQPEHAGPLSSSYWPASTAEQVKESTVTSLLLDAQRQSPGKVALVAGAPDPSERRRWTYSELAEQAERVARALLERFEPGERVAVWAPNAPEWVLLELGAAMAGVVLVTLNPVLRPREIAYALRQSRSSGLFVVPEIRGNPTAPVVEELRHELPNLREVESLAGWEAFLASAGSASTAGPLPEVAAGDPAQIQYTSGTTGFPKGALLSHRGITNNASFCAQRLEVTGDDIWVNPMPLFHTGGCVLAVLGAIAANATQVLVPFFDPGLVLELAESERATVMGGVPTMLIAELEHPGIAGRDLSRLRSVLSGGSTVPADLVRQVEATLGVRFGIVFGQTESSPVITQTRLDDSLEDKALTIGQPLPQTEVKIVDPASGEVLPPGATGELCTRGYLMMLGYFDMPEATAEAIDAEGWLHTGDLCSMDERGYCKVEGRLKDMIIRGGENIYPREIEELLFTHPGVADVAVVGVPDARWGEQVAAFVRPAAGHEPSEADLAAFASEHLAPHKVPRTWVFMDELPLTASGKVQKFVLRERLAGG